MKVYNTSGGIYISKGGLFYKPENQVWDDLINRDNLFLFLKEITSSSKAFSEEEIADLKIYAPISKQEIWAAGVTYLRSREARMDEAKESGAADFYARVYMAERPELFFKSTATRCAGTEDFVYIRKDSKWNVPEPELTLLLTSNGQIAGYTIGNDMSSRDIEGENPLYLPQAKCYDKSAAIGPCLFVPENPIKPDTKIKMTILRNKSEVFTGEISISQMKRKHQELAAYLFREMSFPDGVYLMTGTCLVPPNEFTLEPGDRVSISIDEIGTLTNVVAVR